MNRIELTARHRDYENNAIWEDAEYCECCGKKVIDVWAASVGGVVYQTLGRECVRKVAGFITRRDHDKAEAEYNRKRREVAEAQRIACLIERGAQTTDEELITIIREKLPEKKQQSWIDLLTEPKVRANIIQMAERRR
jgi:hypothetical protein